MSLHNGHRGRLKNRFISSGIDDFDDHNILELLLFFALPRIDTNEIAHKLLNEFKTISNVLDASYDDLCKIGGIGEHAAALLKLIPALSNVYNQSKVEKIKVVTSTNEAGRFFAPRFIGKLNEEVHIMFLDDKKKVIKAEKMFEGTVNVSTISIRKIISMALAVNATGVILAHNHPGGVALPSSSDIITTKMLLNTLKLIDIQLCDHIIVADGDFVSMADSGMLEDF